jgi:hypothetical protein
MPLYHGFNNLWKIYSISYGFSYFVISISGHGQSREEAVVKNVKNISPKPPKESRYIKFLEKC